MILFAKTEKSENVAELLTAAIFTVQTIFATEKTNSKIDTVMYIQKINGPEDVKQLSGEQLGTLCTEVREALLRKLSTHGGHFGPNLGMVEATVALHYVFNSPVDKIVYDVSHQSYPHKMLTGRRDAFLQPEHFDGVSGYTEPGESEHDFFVIGHTSTSVSLACGLAKGRDLQGGHENIIAVIGDGSLSGGEALEALDYASELESNLIIIVNDNQMSIAENHGGLYRNLTELRESNGQCANNFFKTLGLDYLYVHEGNNVSALIKAFRKVKDSQHPVVVHINTLKGKGYALAEQNREAWHYSMPFDLETGEPKAHSNGESYENLTATYLLQQMKKDEKLVAITAGTPSVFGFTPDRRKEAGKQFIDVGIAEEHAVAMASGIAARGGHPVYGVFSTFIQRTYDQLSQDLCINDNPATILVFWGGLSSMNDVTHLCFFDISLLCNIPNLVYLAPTSKQEYLAMLEWSLTYTEHPVAIRVPSNGVIDTLEPVDTDYSKLNRYKVTRKGKGVAIMALGSFYQLGESVADKLKEQFGQGATLINPRYITGLDEKLLEELKADHRLVITLEDGVIDGGYGEKIARYYGASDMKVLNYGSRKEFVDRIDVAELLKSNRLTVGQILTDIQQIMKF